MIVMQSMELDDEAKLDACLPMPCALPDFPYGLRLSLTEKEFDKLGIDPAAAMVGGICHGHFMARICSVSANEGSDGNTCRVELQIESLAIESEDDENN